VHEGCVLWHLAMSETTRQRIWPFWFECYLAQSITETGSRRCERLSTVPQTSAVALNRPNLPQSCAKAHNKEVWLFQGAAIRHVFSERLCKNVNSSPPPSSILWPSKLLLWNLKVPHLVTSADFVANNWFPIIQRLNIHH